MMGAASPTVAPGTKVATTSFVADSPVPVSRVFRVRDDVAVEDFEDGGLVLRLSGRQLVELDPVALFIVQSTYGARSVGEVVAMVSAHFDGADGDVERDVLELYESLLASRVVDEVTEGRDQHGE